jgi:cytochrome P450
MLIKSMRAAFAVEDTLLDGIQVAAVFITIGHHHTWIVDIALSTRAPPILNVSTAFRLPLPMEIIAEILGVSAGHMDRFKRWSDDMTARFGPLLLERQIECAHSEVEFQHYFADQLEEPAANSLYSTMSAS